MKKIILLMAIGLVFVFSGVVEAKLLPRFKGSPAKVGKKQTVSYSGLIISPKIRSDRQALVVTFSNLQKVKSVTYTLMYQTSSGEDQGVNGTLDSSSGSSATRELLFGTCSDVCRYHSNISNMKLEVVSLLPNGKQTLKRYRIKI